MMCVNCQSEQEVYSTDNIPLIPGIWFPDERGVLFCKKCGSRVNHLHEPTKWRQG